MAQKLLNRHDKRQKFVVLRGKKVKVLEYLKTVAAELPKMVFPDGTVADHFAELNKFYMKDGLPGAQKYIKHCQKVLNRDYRNYKRAQKWTNFKNSLKRFFGFSTKPKPNELQTP